MNKIYGILGSIMIGSMLIVGCSNQQDETSDSVSVKEEQTTETVSNQGIVAGEIKPDLLTIKNGGYNFEYVLKNQTEKTKEFTFNSGMKFDYAVYNDKNKKVHQHSEGMMFTQAIEEISLKPGESHSFGIVELKNLQPGTYKLEVWLTSTDKETYKINREVTVN